MKTNYIALLTLLVLFIGIAPSTTQSHLMTDSFHEVIQVGDLVVVVPTAEVAFYQFWNINDNNTVYKVHFDTMFEFNDLNNNSQYDQLEDTLVGQSMTPLAQMTWELSEVSSFDGVTSFNLTGLVTGPNPNVDPDLIIQFRNHITVINDSASLKFDIVINNYSWKSDDALLALGFKLDVSDPNFGSGPKKYQTAQTERAQFGGGFMESVPYANCGIDGNYSHQIQSSLTIGNGTTFSGQDTNPRIFISYEHFDGDLIHDPTLGIDQTDHTFEVANLNIKVPTVQVPFYFFWLDEDPETTYRVGFDTLFEVNDTNSDGIYEPEIENLVASSVYPLAMQTWEMSELSTDTLDGVDYIHFNLSGTPSTNPQSGNVTIQLRNHIRVDGNQPEIKFDVVIRDYEWVKPAESTLLVIGFKITTTHDQNGEPVLNNDKAVFGNAYMHSVETALVNNGTSTYQVQTAMSVGTGSKVDSSDTTPRIYIAYSYFEGDLDHDPTLGVDEVEEFTTDTSDTDTSSDPNSDDGKGTDHTETPWFTVPLLIAVALPVMLRRISSKR